MATVAESTDHFEVMVQGDAERCLVPRHRNWKALKTSALVRGNLRNIAWHQCVLPWFARQRGYDVLFLLAANRRLPWRPMRSLAGAPPMVGTVHDMAALHVPGKYGFLRDGYALRVMPPLIRGLDHVLAISESTRRDLLEHVRMPADRVSVTPLAVDPAVFHAGDRDHARRRVAEFLNISSPYLLYTSRLEHPGKNHVRLIRAFANLKRRTGCPHRLVLAGKPWPGWDPIRAEVAKAGEAIAMPGFVQEDLLPDLYRAADGFVFPSLHEGFGLPLLEAMASGIPVACSNTSSMPEVAGDAALLFDPHDEAAIERAIEVLLFDEDVRRKLSAAGPKRAETYRWERTARLTLDALRRNKSTTGDQVS